MVLIEIGETTRAPALQLRTLVLFDATTQPQSWNARMAAVVFTRCPVARKQAGA